MKDRIERIFTKKFILLLIIPLLVEQALSMTIGMADTMMVANAGEKAVSGIALVDSISILLIQLFTAFATGGAVVASQYLGKKDSEKAGKAAKGLLEVTIIVSTIILILGLVGNRHLLRLIFGDIETEVLDAADIYFFYILLSYPFLGIINSANALFRSMGKSTITMVVSFVINIINITGNAILIFIFHMGTAGAGIASLVSRVIGAIILLIVLFRGKGEIRIKDPMRPEWDKKIIRKIVRIALPAGIEGSIFQLGKVMVQTFIAGFGTVAIAANATVNNINGFANIPGVVIGLASITIIGQCCGAERFDSARFYAKRLLGATYLIMAATCSLFFLATPSLVSLYNLSAESTALAIRANRLTLIWTATIWPLSFTVPNFIKATGDAKYTMKVAIFSMWIFRIFFSYILGVKLGYGLIGILYGMYFDWICRTVFFVHHFFMTGWDKKENL